MWLYLRWDVLAEREEWFEAEEDVVRTATRLWERPHTLWRLQMNRRHRYTNTVTDQYKPVKYKWTRQIIFIWFELTNLKVVKKRFMEAEQEKGRCGLWGPSKDLAVKWELDLDWLHVGWCEVVCDIIRIIYHFVGTSLAQEGWRINCSSGQKLNNIMPDIINSQIIMTSQMEYYLVNKAEITGYR